MKRRAYGRDGGLTARMVTVTFLLGLLYVFFFIVLYMLNPLDMVAGFLPVMSRANIAVRRIEEISGSLANAHGRAVTAQMP